MTNSLSCCQKIYVMTKFSLFFISINLLYHPSLLPLFWRDGLLTCSVAEEVTSHLHSSVHYRLYLQFFCSHSDYSVSTQNFLKQFPQIKVWNGSKVCVHSNSFGIYEEPTTSLLISLFFFFFVFFLLSPIMLRICCRSMKPSLHYFSILTLQLWRI